jgi:hypothetical protein
MNLAAIFVIVIYFLGLGGPSLGSPAAVGISAAQDQAPPAQGAHPAPASPSPPTPNAAPPAKHRKPQKKTILDCSDSPAALNPASGSNPAPASNGDPAKPGSDETHSSETPPTQIPSTQTPSAQTAASEPAAPNPAAAKPCPPPKKVVKNGGSDEPIVELKGDTTAEQASLQRTTSEQLTVATEQNLKKVGDRPLSPSQQEMVSQVKQFMDQSKKAIAAGNLQLGHNLAVKANLLSAELVKP